MLLFVSLPSLTPQGPSDSGTGILAPDLSKEKTNTGRQQCESNINENLDVSPTYLGVTFNVYVTFDHRAKRGSHPADRTDDLRQGQQLRPDETPTELRQEEQIKRNQNDV